jgi:hypothetical protein
MKVNTIDVIERHNRPDVMQKVGLRVLFYNDGILVDPYEISSVSVFSKDATFDPSTILDGATLASSTSAIVHMNFGNSATLTTDSIFDASNYTPGTTASGVFKLDTGDYVVILDGTVALSGAYEGVAIANSASATKEYVDVWTVKMSAGSSYKALINQFELFDDTFFTITEPLILHTSTKLVNKHFKLGSKQKIHVTTKINIENNIDQAIQNIFKDSVLTDAQFRIVKLNDGSHLANHVEVSGFSDTSALIDITSNNDMLLLWDTNDLKTHASVATGAFGSITGTYMLQVKYTVLDEDVQSQDFYFIVS